MTISVVIQPEETTYSVWSGGLSPRWGKYELGNVRTIEVESWLRSLPRARGTEAVFLVGQSSDAIKYLKAFFAAGVGRPGSLHATRTPVCLLRNEQSYFEHDFLKRAFNSHPCYRRVKCGRDIFSAVEERSM